MRNIKTSPKRRSPIRALNSRWPDSFEKNLDTVRHSAHPTSAFQFLVAKEASREVPSEERLFHLLQFYQMVKQGDLGLESFLQGLLSSPIYLEVVGSYELPFGKHLVMELLHGLPSLACLLVLKKLIKSRYLGLYAHEDTLLESLVKWSRSADCFFRKQTASSVFHLLRKSTNLSCIWAYFREELDQASLATHLALARTECKVVGQTEEEELKTELGGESKYLLKLARCFPSEMKRSALNLLKEEVPGSSFKDFEEEVKSFIASEDCIVDCFGVVIALIKEFPDEMKSNALILKRKLQTMLSSRDPKLESLAFETIDEYSRISPSTPFNNFIVTLVKDYIQVKNEDILFRALNSLSLLVNFDCLTGKDYDTLMLYLKKYEKNTLPNTSHRSALMKLVGALAKHQVLTPEDFTTAFNIIETQSKLSNLTVAINSSLAVSFLCLNPLSITKLPEIISIIERNNQNKKEKVVSNAVISIGNLFETFSYKDLQIGFEKLFNICVQALPHKNAKVGWDATGSLFKFFKNSKMPHSKVASYLISELTKVVLTQKNYKTRISAVELLRYYSLELAAAAPLVIKALIESLEDDSSFLVDELTVLEYQKKFHYEAVLTIIHTLECVDRPDKELENCLSEYLVYVSDWLEQLVQRSLKEQLRVEGVCSKILDWVTKYPSIQISLGLLDEMTRMADQDNFFGEEPEFVVLN